MSQAPLTATKVVKFSDNEIKKVEANITLLLPTLADFTDANRLFSGFGLEFPEFETMLVKLSQALQAPIDGDTQGISDGGMLYTFGLFDKTNAVVFVRILATGMYNDILKHSFLSDLGVHFGARIVIINVAGFADVRVKKSADLLNDAAPVTLFSYKNTSNRNRAILSLVKKLGLGDFSLCNVMEKMGIPENEKDRVVLFGVKIDKAAAHLKNARPTGKQVSSELPIYEFSVGNNSTTITSYSELLQQLQLQHGSGTKNVAIINDAEKLVPSVNRPIYGLPRMLFQISLSSDSSLFDNNIQAFYLFPSNYIHGYLIRLVYPYSTTVQLSSLVNRVSSLNFLTHTLKCLLTKGIDANDESMFNRVCALNDFEKIAIAKRFVSDILAAENGTTAKATRAHAIISTISTLVESIEIPVDDAVDEQTYNSISSISTPVDMGGELFFGHFDVCDPFVSLEEDNPQQGVFLAGACSNNHDTLGALSSVCPTSTLCRFRVNTSKEVIVVVPQIHLVPGYMTPKVSSIASTHLVLHTNCNDNSVEVECGCEMHLHLKKKEVPLSSTILGSDSCCPHALYYEKILKKILDVYQYADDVYKENLIANFSHTQKQVYTYVLIRITY